MKALVIDVSTTATPACVAVTVLSMARVAEAAALLALLTRPPSALTT